MTEVHRLTAAEQIHRGTFAEMHVEEVVDAIAGVRGYPKTIVLDNGTELTSRRTSEDRAARFHITFAGPIKLQNTPPPLRSSELFGRGSEHTQKLFG